LERFSLAEQNGYLKIFIKVFWRKWNWGCWLVALQSVWSLKKGTRTFSFRSNPPSPDLLGPLFQYEQPRGKNNQKLINIIKILDKSHIRDMSSGKNSKISHFFYIGA
jgi:hypothetical protein